MATRTISINWPQKVVFESAKLTKCQLISGNWRKVSFWRTTCCYLTLTSTFEFQNKLVHVRIPSKQHSEKMTVPAVEGSRRNCWDFRDLPTLNKITKFHFFGGILKKNRLQQLFRKALIHWFVAVLCKKTWHLMTIVHTSFKNVDFHLQKEQKNLRINSQKEVLYMFVKPILLSFKKVNLPKKRCCYNCPLKEPKMNDFEGQEKSNIRC